MVALVPAAIGSGIRLVAVTERKRLSYVVTRALERELARLTRNAARRRRET